MKCWNRRVMDYWTGEYWAGELRLFGMSSPSRLMQGMHSKVLFAEMSRQF